MTAPLTEYVEATLALALLEAGRRPSAADKAAAVLTPVVLQMLDDPRIRQLQLLPLEPTPADQEAQG